MTDNPDPDDKKTSPKPRSRQLPPAGEQGAAGDNYELSGDFRGAVINIKSTIVSNAEAKQLEDLSPEPGEPPFQGLQYFDEQDAGRFFGRETLVARIVGRLAKTRFLTVIGASGSGKSSIVRAGVIPALRRGERLADASLPPTDSGQWDIRILTPSAHPLDALAACLMRESESVSAAAILSSELAREPQVLSLAARRLLALNGKKHLLLVIDQFEEVYTQCRHNDERQAFIDNLLHAVDPADLQPVTIVLTLRADFYAQLALEDLLREQVSQNQEFIGAMNRAELTQAILKPAALGNWKVQEGLVDVILNDLGSEPGALPLLSHALLETWKLRRGRVLTLSGYNAAGGVRSAIAQTAETVFHQRLSAEQQPIARMIFIKLAEMGDGALDTRRRATFSELITRSTDTATIDTVLTILTDARLVTTNTLEPGNTRVVEVAHEALIREWPTLRAWLDQNRAGLILHRQLTEDANDWRKLQRDPGSLYRGMRLQQGLEWAKSNSDLISLAEQEFLDASQTNASAEQAQIQRLARARWVQAALGSAAVLLAGVVLVVFLAVNGVFAPRKMDGVFNIAVAEFGELGADGQLRPSPAGKQMSAWVVNDLREALKDDPNLQIWPNQGNLFNRTRVALVRPQEAEAITRDINASLLIYGMLDGTRKPAELVLKFWIAPQVKYNFEEIQGSFSVGSPIRIVDLKNPGLSAGSELGRQANALAWVGIGLSQEQLGQAEDALKAFQRAAEFAPQSEVIQFFIGREYLFLSDRQPERQAANWQAAQDAFEQAIRLNARYPRPYIGLGSTYFKRAASLVDTANAAQKPIDPQANQWAERAIEAYQHVLDLNPDPAQFGNPLGDVAKSALGNAYRLKGAIASSNGDQASAAEALKRSIEMLEAVRLVFEKTSIQHESYHRYLAQVYEHLGEAYQEQGRAFELALDYPQALTSYANSLAAYDLCRAQGEDTLDLIIKNNIVALRCEPYYQKLKLDYDALKGGQ